MAQVSVREMTPAEFDSWQEQLARDYADEQVAAGNWSADEALRRALDLNAQLLPAGLDTEDMLVLQGVLEDGTSVGRAWIALRHPRGAPDCAFLYDIEIDAEHRGRGLGRSLLVAAEEAVRARGIEALELNVFGNNTAATSLYASAGYAVVTQQMRKQLPA